MAIFHFSMSLVRRCNPSTGKTERAQRKASWRAGGVEKDRSAVGAAAYRAGARLRDEQDGRVHDYRSRTGVFASEILLPDGAPSWMRARGALWNAAELAERRYDARVAREINMAIPAELDHAARVSLVRSFVEREFVAKGLAADVAFHDFTSRNPHAHVMMSMREVTPDGFGRRVRELDTWGDRAQPEHGATWVAELRERWAQACNDSLSQLGITIDHRSLAAQGAARLPTVHLGPKWTALNREQPETPMSKRDARSRANDAVVRLNAVREQAWLAMPDTDAAARAATAHYLRQRDAWMRRHGRHGARLDRLLRDFDPARSADEALRRSPAYQQRRSRFDQAQQSVPSARRRHDEATARYGRESPLVQHTAIAYAAALSYAAEIRRAWVRWLAHQQARWKTLLRLQAEAVERGRLAIAERRDIDRQLLSWVARLVLDGSVTRAVRPTSAPTGPVRRSSTGRVEVG